MEIPSPQGRLNRVQLIKERETDTSGDCGTGKETDAKGNRTARDAEAGQGLTCPEQRTLTVEQGGRPGGGNLIACANLTPCDRIKLFLQKGTVKA